MEHGQKKVPFETPYSFVYDRKFDIALRKSTLTLFADRYEKFELTDDDRHITEAPEFDDAHLLYTPECLSRLISQLMQGPGMPDIPIYHRDIWITRALDLACQNVLFQMDYMTHNDQLECLRNALCQAKCKLSQLRADPFLTQIAMQVTKWGKIVDKLPKMSDPILRKLSKSERIIEQRKVNSAKIKELGLSIWWSSSLCAIKMDNGDIFICPKPYILMIHNKLCDLLSVLVLTLCNSGSVYPQSSYLDLKKFLSYGCRYSQILRNKFYVLTGCIEGLITGITLQRVDQWDNNELLTILIAEILDETGLDLDSSDYLAFLKSLSTPILHEFACLSKIWGHPYVSLEKGCVKLHKRTTQPLKVDPMAVQYCVNAAKEVYVRNYIFRHGKWPPVELSFSPVKPDPLEQAMLRNKDPYHVSISSRYGKIRVEDWVRINVLPTMTFALLENIIPLLKDKTISVLRGQVLQHYIHRTMNQPPSWDETRLLLKYLLSSVSSMDHLKYLQQYVSSPDLDELSEYLVMRIVPKEKEHKEAFRGFGIKTYEDRLRGLIQEKNVMKFLEMYSEEQAMTMGEEEITKRLYALRTAEKAYPGHTKLIITFDASGWNNRFRFETTFPVLRETLDRIFDYPIFGKTHQAFEKTFYFVPDPGGTYYWDGQQGGIEGLNQDSWVWVYLQQIRYALKDQNFPYHIFCKGDDLRVVVLLHPSLLEEKPLEVWKNEIVSSVAEAAKKFGHEIKIQESYGSAEYLAFSKIASVGTIELGQSFRKIQKAYGANNAFIATLDEYISSTLSNAHAAARFSSAPSGTYIVGCVWLFFYLLTSEYYKDLADEQLLALSLTPSLIGGLPIIYLHNMFVRAESDLLSPFIDMTVFALMKYPRIASGMMKFLFFDIPPSPSWSRLYRDPYSLNITIPPLPTAILRAQMITKLKRVVKNEDILALITASESPFSETIVTILSQANIQQVKVFAAIYASLPVSILGELLRKFESGRSVLELLLLRSNTRMANLTFRRVQQAERRLQLWRRGRITGSTRGKVLLLSVNEIICPSKAAQDLRELTWGAKIEGITMPPISHLTSLTTPAQSLGDEHARRNHFLIEYTPPDKFMEAGVSPHWASSGKRPMMGHTTSSGNIAPVAPIASQEGTVVKVKDLLDLLSWVTISQIQSDGSSFVSNVQELIKEIIKTLTGISALQLAPFSSIRKSGTLAHHGRSPGFRESIVPNILSNRLQMITGLSDTHIHFRSSREHYMMNFLHCFVASAVKVSLELEFSDQLSPPRLIHIVTTNCHWCRTPISETPIVVPLHMFPPDSPDLDKFRACRVDEVTKREVLGSYDKIKGSQFKPSDDSQPPPDMAATAVVQEAIFHKHRTHERLQTRFHQHRITSEGHRTLVDLGLKTTSRIIGTTEMKILPVTKIIQGMAGEITHYCLEQLQCLDPDGISLAISLIDSLELPWTSLLENIRDAGKLGELIRQVQKLTHIPPSVCYTNPASAAAYLGAVLPQYQLKSTLSLDICRLTYFEESDLSIILSRKLALIKAMLVHQWVIPLLDLAQASAWLHQSLRKALDTYYQVLYMQFDLNQIQSDLQKNVSSNEWVIISPIDIAVVDPDVDLDSDCLLGESILHKWIQTKYPGIDWEEWREDWVASNNMFEEDQLAMISLSPMKPIIRLAATDLAHCIEVVRQTTYEESSLSETDLEFVPHRGLPPLVLTTKQGITRRLFSANIGDKPLAPRPDRVYHTDKIVLQTAHGLRPYGCGTSSVNKLIELLRNTSVGINRQYYGLQTACLADGFGGFANLLGLLMVEGTILFNTLPAMTGIEEYPHLAMDTISSRGIDLDVQAMHEGYSDLAEKYVMEVLENSHRIYDIVTCDAEVEWDHDERLEEIWINVATFFIRNSHSQSLLILKLHAGREYLSLQVCEFLARNCEDVILLKPMSSYLGGEIYVLAARPKASYPPYGKRLPAPSAILHARGRGFMDDVWMKYQTILQNKNRQVTLSPSVPKVSHRIIHALGSNAASKGMSLFHQRLGIQTPSEDMMLSSHENLKRVKDKCDTLLLKTLNSLHTRMDVRKTPSEHIDTHMHWLTMYMKILSYTGLLYVLSQTLSGVSHLSENLIRVHFISKYSNADRRLRLPSINSRTYRRTNNIFNRENLNPYDNFMTGIRLGQQVVSYYRNIPRENINIGVDW